MDEIFDMALVTQPKSDQINADDLIAGPRTVTIRGVKLKLGEEQPCSIQIEGDEKVYRPCKGMRSLLMQIWGRDTKQYVGRSLTLYRDPAIKFGADTTGGVRISHMSHIDDHRVVPVTLKRGSRKGWKVAPLVLEQPAKVDQKRARAEDWLAWLKDEVAAAGGEVEPIRAIFASAQPTLKKMQGEYPDLHAEAMKLAPSEGPSPSEKRANGLIIEINAASADELDALEASSAEDIAAMLDETAELVRNAIERRRKALAK